MNYQLLLIGADPQAKIKHIIASANHLNSYLESKAQEFDSLEEADSVQDKLNDAKERLDDLTKEIELLSGEVEEIKSEEENISESGDNEELDVEEASLVDNTAEGDSLGLPAEKLATKELNELHKVIASIESKLNTMNKNLQKLNKETNMSDIKKDAYMQGTEEPTTYPVDPLNQQARKKDKHMVGKAPFTGVGDVNDLYPGDMEIKEKLSRAEEERRSVRRAAAVELAKKALEKKAYPQGTTEPNLGGTTYKPDPLNEQARKSDKQMVGKKPFPGVGKTTDLYPGDLETKKLVNRAGFSGKFVKAANSGDSAWEIYNDDQLVLRASVNELTNGTAALNYNLVATKEYGQDLINKIKSFGADSVKSLLKKAQAIPPAPPADPNAGMAPAPEMPDMSAPAVDEVDSGKSGDPAATVKDLAANIQELASDMSEAVDQLTGEKAELENPEEVQPGMKAASFSTVAANKLRFELNTELTNVMKESIASLEDHLQEVNTVKEMYEAGSLSGQDSAFANSVVDSVVTEAKSAVADGFKLLTAFLKYAYGSEAIIKRAKLEAEFNKLAQTNEDEDMDKKDDNDADDVNLMDMLNSVDSDLAAVEDMMAGDDGEDAYAKTLENTTLNNKTEEVAKADDAAADDGEYVTVKDDTGVKYLVPKNTMKTASFDLSTKAGRQAMRAKLASDLKVSPMLGQAHPKGGFTTDLAVKPESDLAKVEDLEEVQDVMLDIARKNPKVRKDAEKIHQLVSEGKLAKEDVDDLAAYGLDKDAIAYYKKYWGQADGGSEFASELVKEHAETKKAEELNTFKVKMARAYDLAYEMVGKGIISSDRTAISNQVDELMSFSDENFESLKKVVGKQSINKEASVRMPNVGMMDSFEASRVAKEETLFDQISSQLNRSKTNKF